MSKMIKYNPRIRTLSSSSKEKQSVLTPQKSLSKLKERLKSSHVPIGSVNCNERVKEEYMVDRKKNNRVKHGQRQELKTNDYKRRRKESLDMINREIRFENQLREEIKQLNQTLFECQTLDKELIKPKTTQIIQLKSNISTYKLTKLSSIQQNIIYPQNLQELVHIQQKIKNRQRQIASATDQIAYLREQNWKNNINQIPLKEKLTPINLSQDRFILADEMNQLNQLLKQNLQQYRKKYNDLKTMKVNINNAYKDSQYFYQIKVKNSSKDTYLLIEKPITYDVFKQNLLKKRRQITEKQKSQLKRAKSIESIISPGLNQFSNISNISAILPSHFIDQWLNRQLLPGQIPSLPKEPKPTMRSMNSKKKVFKQAILTQKTKHEKQMTSLIDKLLFLHDQNAFLAEQQEKHLQEISSLESRFSWIEMKTRQPTTISKTTGLKTKNKKQQEESSIHFVGKNYNKNYVDGNLLLDNTGNNSTLLDETGKSVRLG